MQNTKQPENRSMIEVFGGRAMLLLFGLGVLGFLVAIDRAEWFSIRPATGTSIAMANAANTAHAASADGTTGKSMTTK